MSPGSVVRGVLLSVVVAAFVTVVPTGSAPLDAAVHARPSVTVEYSGVRVDVPPGWHRVDAVPRWASPGSPAGGVAFYGSATFDTAYGPGVRRVAGGWAGYVYAAEFAVYVSGGDRDLVRKVLDSVRAVRQRGM